MVNAISSTNIINQTQNTQKAEQIQKLVRYANSQTVQETPDTFSSTMKSSAGFIALFEGIPLLKFLARNKKLKGQIFNAAKTIDANRIKAIKETFKGSGKFVDKLSNYFNIISKSREAFSAQKALGKATIKSEKLVTKASNAAKKSGKISQWFAEKALKKSDKFKNTVLSAKTTAAGKATKAIGETAVKKGGFKQLVKSSGAGFMLVFSGVMECATEVVPTFKELGTQKGIKQVGKSAVKVIGDTAGFIAGEQAGMAIGAAIGSIVPGVGTVVGGILGFAGGMIGSYLMGKLTHKIVGDSEREKAKKEQEQQTVKEFSNDAKAQAELKAMVKEKIQAESEQTGGKLSKDAKLALEALEKLDSANPFATV